MTTKLLKVPGLPGEPMLKVVAYSHDGFVWQGEDDGCQMFGPFFHADPEAAAKAWNAMVTRIIREARK